MKRHRPMLGHDDLSVTSHFCEPGTKLLSIRDCRRERNHLHVFGEVENNLFPNSSPKSVGEVVNLVHHHKHKVLECRGGGIDHVSEHLGGHDNDLGLGIVVVIAR